MLPFIFLNCQIIYHHQCYKDTHSTLTIQWKMAWQRFSCFWSNLFAEKKNLQIFRCPPPFSVNTPLRRACWALRKDKRQLKIDKERYFAKRSQLKVKHLNAFGAKIIPFYDITASCEYVSFCTFRAASMKNNWRILPPPNSQRTQGWSQR